jgi:hypothetical protein
VAANSIATVRGTIASGSFLASAEEKMRTVLAFAILTMCVSAVAADSSLAKKFKVTIICRKFGGRSSGLTKVCYYDCGGSEAAIAVNLYDECPNWKSRWRFNRNSQFGPSGISH